MYAFMNYIASKFNDDAHDYELSQNAIWDILWNI